MLDRREFLLAGAAALVPLAAPATARTCIRIHMVGGPSHLDTFDPKPDAPSGIRSPFRPIRTSAPEIRISELFPRIARESHHLAFVRSVHAPVETAHPVFSQVMDFKAACHDAVNRVAAGERRIEIPMFASAADGLTWDMHGWGPFSSFNSYRNRVAPEFDYAFAGLIRDLAQSGLLQSTLVVAMGEFGRAARLNSDGGRDHWPQCFTAIFAGAGVTGGQVYGSSDAQGEEPRDKPVTSDMIEATIACALGERPRDGHVLNLST